MQLSVAVEGSGVVLAYGELVALERSDFQVPRGSITAVMGPNGSGKTTLLNGIAGLTRPIAGTIRVHGEDRRHRNVAYVLQSTRVNEAMPVTVQEVVSMGRYGRLGPLRPFGEQDRRACRAAMQTLDIQDLAVRHLDQLSGGQRQRVFVAQGLAQEAGTLLLDEPITGLDLVSRGRILEALNRERERGTTIVMTTHDLEEASEADCVLLLSGRVLASGPPDRVLTPALLSEAYGVRLTALEGGQVVLDDAHHRAAHRRHVHFDRTGHAGHSGEAGTDGSKD